MVTSSRFVRFCWVGLLALIPAGCDDGSVAGPASELEVAGIAPQMVQHSTGSSGAINEVDPEFIDRVLTGRIALLHEFGDPKTAGTLIQSAMSTRAGLQSAMLSKTPLMLSGTTGAVFSRNGGKLGANESRPHIHMAEGYGTMWMPDSMQIQAFGSIHEDPCADPTLIILPPECEYDGGSEPPPSSGPPVWSPSGGSVIFNHFDYLYFDSWTKASMPVTYLDVRGLSWKNGGTLLANKFKSGYNTKEVAVSYDRWLIHDPFLSDWDQDGLHTARLDHEGYPDGSLVREGQSHYYTWTSIDPY